MSGTRAQRGRRRPLLALALSLLALAGGVVVLASGGGERAQAAFTSDLEGEAWIMQGTIYNTPQPAFHRILLPPGGTDDSELNFNFNSSNQFLLFASSSHVTCNASGNTPGASSAHSTCELVLENLQVNVGPYQIIGASRLRVASSSSSGNGQANSFVTVTIDDLCVYIEQDYANGCRTPAPGGGVTFDRPPISGTVSRPISQTFVTNGDQLGKGSSAVALHIDLFNADYTTSTGIGSVTLDIGFATSFAGLPDPTPTPTRTPTRTPTPTGTPGFKALLPGLSRDD